MTKMLVTAEEMQLFATQCAQYVDSRLLVFLKGDLGAGKTTFARGWLQGMGYTGKVKSPTYSLVEPYQINEKKIYHIDLYRLNYVEELAFIGIRDYLTQICLIEWPERAETILPEPDICITISCEGLARQLTWQGVSEDGKQLTKKIRHL